MKICKNNIIDKNFCLHTGRKEYGALEQAPKIIDGDYIIDLTTGDKYTYSDLSKDNMLSNFIGYKKGWIYTADFQKRLETKNLDFANIPSYILDEPVVSMESAFEKFSHTNIKNICKKIVKEHFEKEINKLDIPIYCKDDIKKNSVYISKMEKSIDDFTNDVIDTLNIFYKNILIPETIVNMDNAFKETTIKELPIIPENVKSINGICAFSDIRFVANLPHNIKFAKRAFFNCEKLVAVILENNFTKANKSDITELFSDCKNLIYFSDTGTFLTEEHFHQCISLRYRPKYFGENTTTIFPDRVSYGDTKPFLDDKRVKCLGIDAGMLIAENAKSIAEKEKIFDNLEKYISENISPLNSLNDFYL